MVFALLGENINFVTENDVIVTFLPSVSVMERVMHLPIHSRYMDEDRCSLPNASQQFTDLSVYWDV